MLRRLFRGADPLEDDDPQKRRQAVIALSEAEAVEKADWLEGRLTSDPDPGVRRACLERVSRAGCLESLLEDPDLGEAAAQRIVHLSPEGRPGEHPRVTETRLLLLPPEAAGEQAAKLQDANQLISLTLQARDPLRQKLLEHPLLRSANGLVSLEKRSRGHDKKLNRHAREALESLKQQRLEAETARRRVEELSVALGRTALGASASTEHSRRLALYQAFTENADRYDQLSISLSSCGERIPTIDHLRAATAAPAQEEASDDGSETMAATAPTETLTAAAGETADPFAELTIAFAGLEKDLANTAAVAALNERCSQLTRDWLTLAEAQSPAPEQLALFTSVSQRLQQLNRASERLSTAILPDPADLRLPASLPESGEKQRALWTRVAENRTLAKDLARLRKEIDWPEWADPTPSYSRLLEIQNELKQVHVQAEDLLNAQIAEITQKVDQLESAVEDGGLSDAQKLMSEARSLCDLLPAPGVAGLQKRLGRCASRLAELKDWQTFATTPKRQALCEAMGSLVASPLPPRRQADRIKKLRSEWLALGPITQTADRRLAEDFNEQAEKAFEPCRAFFAGQAEQRQRNLSDRQRICDQLETYLEATDWRQADMKAAERIMRAARDEWRRFHPVDRNPGAVLEERFEALQERLYQKIKSEWERNLAAKGDIVIEAEALAGNDASPKERIAAVKALQQRWKAIGITPRKPDQEHWQRFRAACDLVFAELDASRQALQTETEARRTRNEQALDQFASALAGTTADSAEESVLSGFMKLKTQLEELPAGVKNSLLRRHDELSGRYRALLAQRAVVERGRTLNELRQADAATVAADSETAADIEQLRSLTVSAELAAGLDSPADDEPLRLQLQVERLNAGFSGSADAPDPLALARRWSDLGAKSEAAATLRDRFFAALLKGWD